MEKITKGYWEGTVQGAGTHTGSHVAIMEPGTMRMLALCGPTGDLESERLADNIVHAFAMHDQLIAALEEVSRKCHSEYDSINVFDLERYDKLIDETKRGYKPAVCPDPTPEPTDGKRE